MICISIDATRWPESTDEASFLRRIWLDGDSWFRAVGIHRIRGETLRTKTTLLQDGPPKIG